MVVARRPRGWTLALGVAAALTIASCASDAGGEVDESVAPVTTVPAVPAGAPTTVTLIGDSLAVEAADFLPALLTGQAFVPQSFGGTAVCDWLPKDLGLAAGTVAIVSFSGNNGTPCMVAGGTTLQGDELVARYRSDTIALIDLALRAGSSVVLVGQPARGDPDGNATIDALNALYRELAAAPGVSFIDAGAAVETVEGAFTPTLPCFPSEPTCDAAGSVVVRSDDQLHFCPGAYQTPCGKYSPGAFRFAGAIVPAAVDPTAFD